MPRPLIAEEIAFEHPRRMQTIAKAGAVDLLAFVDPKDPENRPSLAKGPVPAVLVAMEPTELIVTQGEPSYVPIDGTQLLYVTTTTGHVFKHIGDQNTYVLVTGRWFRAAALTGPWTYVPGKDLPPDFAKIPDESPKENVKASVPGTAQAQEAVIANSLPETAAIKRADAKLPTPKYDGPPQLRPIEGTALSYVVNSPIPVIQVTPTSYYALESGGWQQNSGSAWGNVSQSTQTEALNREQQVRTTAQTRVNNYRASGGYQGGGGFLRRRPSPVTPAERLGRDLVTQRPE